MILIKTKSAKSFWKAVKRLVDYLKDIKPLEIVCISCVYRAFICKSSGNCVCISCVYRAFIERGDAMIIRPQPKQEEFL